MKVQNNASKKYFLVFEKQLAFARFCGISDTKEDLKILLKELKEKRPEAKFFFLEMPKGKEIHI